MKIIVLDGRKMTDRETVHTYLKRKLELPEYYGSNLDALYDCLTEMENLEIQVKMPDETTPYFERIIRVLKGAQMASDTIVLKILE